MYERKTIDRSSGDRITVTTEFTRITTYVMEVAVAPSESEIVLSIRPVEPDGIGGASIGLSPEQAVALAQQLISAT